VRADAVLDAVGLAVDDAHLLHVGAEHLGGDLRHHGLKALPDRSAAGDDLDCAEVSTWMRTPSAGPRPAFSTNMARPTPTISPFSRRAASSRLSLSHST
jgi:hypothetical protein